MKDDHSNDLLKFGSNIYKFGSAIYFIWPKVYNIFFQLFPLVCQIVTIFSLNSLQKNWKGLKPMSNYLDL